MSELSSDYLRAMHILGIDENVKVLDLKDTELFSEAKRRQIAFSKKHHSDTGESDPRFIEELKIINQFMSEWGAKVRAGLSFELRKESTPSISEEDVWSDIEQMKEDARARAQSKYSKKNGEDIRITRKIDFERAITNGKIKLSITGELKMSLFATQREHGVEIPHNLKPGGTLKLAGKGMPGLFGGANGDLYITLLSNRIKTETPPPPPPRPTPPRIDPFDYSRITQVNEVGDKRWWKVGAAIFIIFIMIKLLSGLGSSSQDSGIPSTSDQNSAQQSTTDGTNAQATPDVSESPTPEQSTIISGDLGSSAGDGSTPSPTESAVIPDPGATGNLNG
jgi:curved DNA-binding protein CbpA